MDIKKIYKMLLEEYGRQGWWPVTPFCGPETQTTPVYGIKTRTEKQKLEICIGAILTQNTSWKNADKAIVILNKNNLIDVNNLKKIKKEELAQLIKSSGYYNQKAAKIKNFIDFLIKNHKGNLELLFKLNKGELRKELLSISGIGKETADSIILYAAKKPVFVVDAYTKRIFERLFNLKFKEYDDWQSYFEKNLGANLSWLFSFPPNRCGGKKKADDLGKTEKLKQELYNEYHALLVEFGKRVCRKEPLCKECFFSKNCFYFKQKYLNSNKLN